MPSATLRPARVRVPCSTSNLGAGFDSIGLAFNAHLTATFSPDQHALRVHRSGTGAALPDDQDALKRAFVSRLTEHGATPHGTLAVLSMIPLTRGLGSSAAATVAGLALADAVIGLAPNHDELLQRAMELEGHPDNAAPSLHGGLVAVARDLRGNMRAFPLPLSPDLEFAFAAPDVEVRTPDARRALPAKVDHALATRSIGRTAALLQGLANADPDLLRLGFTDELHVPYRLPLIPNAAQAIDGAIAAGAWAVTISGSGSGMIAVGPPGQGQKIAAAMALAFNQKDSEYAFAAQPDVTGVLYELEV